MPQDGISFGGEVNGTPDPEDDTTQIEIPADDPSFLPRVAQKNPPSALERARSILGSFAEGAYSWPFDYTLGIHWAVGMTGFYGAAVRQNCVYHGQRVSSLLRAGLRVAYYLVFRGLLWRLMSNETAQNLASEALDAADRERLMEDLTRSLPDIENAGAQFAGRFASGAFFNRWMQSRVRGAQLGRAQGAASVGLMTGNFIILMWGSAIHSSIRHPGDFGIIEIFVAMINGDASYTIDSETYTEIFRLASQLEQNPAFADALGEDYELYREFLGHLLEFHESRSLP